MNKDRNEIIISSLFVVSCISPFMDLSNNSSIHKEFVDYSNKTISNKAKLGSYNIKPNTSNYLDYNYNYSLSFNTLSNNCLFEESIKDETLKTISKLKKNWNGNNANPFKESLILKIDDIVSKLSYKPFIAPTACGAIQLEYEKDSGEYLEFEMYENNINVFKINSDDTEEEQTINYDSIDILYQLVKQFYA